MSQPTRTEAIARYLLNKTHADLAALYHAGMEVQVNVARDGGEKEKGEYKGKEYVVWTDGVEKWKSFRIPYKAMTDTPEYTDVPMSFSLDKHAEGIGMTGWNWKEQKSIWCAYDFDTIVGHSERHTKKLTDVELQGIQKMVENVPWVTLRRSTGGGGLHLYVFLEPIETKSHTEHAALARAILNMLSALVGYEFATKVDTCGGNMWVWHRKLKGEGLKLLKAGDKLTEIPKDWRNHVPVVSQRTQRVTMKDIKEPDMFDQLCGQRPKTPLDSGHKLLIEYLQNSKAFWWWDNDLWMLVTHTSHLKDAHTKLNLRGRFETLAKGEEKGFDHNCYAFPIKDGSWVVRRYTQKTEEASTWQVDNKGWTRCFFNKKTDLKSASLSNGGMVHPHGGYAFNNVKQVQGVLSDLGFESALPFEGMTPERKCRITTAKKDATQVTFSIESHYREQSRIAKASNTPVFVEPTTSSTGWILEKKNAWIKLYEIALEEEPDKVENYDDILRHVVSESDEDRGWLVRSSGGWRDEPLTHAKAALASSGFPAKEINDIIGTQVLQPWTLVNKPFQPEYPGNREWNRGAAQIAFAPSSYVPETVPSTWGSVLSHCGSGLDEVVKGNDWCKKYNVLSGADYLLLWVASMLRHPYAPLPYLFFYGDQNCGKSTFHVALKKLFTKGYMRADSALDYASQFNGELLNAVLCVIEEKDFRNSKATYNKIKDWVTSPEVLIHIKGQTPYMAKNTTKWIHCANGPENCPIFSGDTRITMIHVSKLETIIPPEELEGKLLAEAADFLAYVNHVEIPVSGDRLKIPVLTTSDKIQMAEMNKNPVELFIEMHCHEIDGQAIPFSEFYAAFLKDIPMEEQKRWMPQTVTRCIPMKYPKGKLSNNPASHIGNLSFDPDAPPLPKLFRTGDSQVLKRVTDLSMAG